MREPDAAVAVLEAAVQAVTTAFAAAAAVPAAVAGPAAARIAAADAATAAAVVTAAAAASAAAAATAAGDEHAAADVVAAGGQLSHLCCSCFFGGFSSTHLAFPFSFGLVSYHPSAWLRLQLLRLLQPWA